MKDTQPTPSLAVTGNGESGRLESWKGIAAYLKRDVRTVQRWEQREGLPVRRHFHNRMGTVYAFQSELDAWWAERRIRLEAQDAPDMRADPSEPAAAAGAPPAVPEVERHQPASALPSQALAERPTPWYLWWAGRVVTAGVLFIMIAAAFLVWRAGHKSGGGNASVSAARRITLAVLPFVNLSGDPSQEYFADGLTEEMISDLGRLDPARLGVIARTSAMKYKNATEDVHQIGQELGADYALEGSVRRQGNVARITAQLIRVSDQTHVWAQDYDRQVKDVLGVQEEVARTIAGKIQLNVAPAAQAGFDTDRSVNPEAHDLYLKGRYYWNKRSPEGLHQALDYFNQAVALDPNYAQAYVGLADCYNLLREYTPMPADEAYPRALEAATKAVALDDASAEAHNSLAFVSFYWKWDPEGAEREFARALALSPNYALAHHWHATFLMTLGRFQEALEEIERARALDPSSTAVLADKGLILFYAGQRDGAIALLKQIEGTEPEFLSSHTYLSTIYLDAADYPDYLVESRTAAQLLRSAPALEISAAAEKGFAAGGRLGMLEGTLQAQQRLYGQRLIPAYPVARTCALLGKKPEALEHLRTAYQKHDDDILAMRVDHAFENLRQDPAFVDLTVRVGLRPI